MNSSAIRPFGSRVRQTSNPTRAPRQRGGKKQQALIERIPGLTTLQVKFLARYPYSVNSAETCVEIGANRNTFYKWMDDPVFAEAFKQAEKDALALLESTAHQRALQRSDAMLIFLLKKRLPEKYGDKVSVAEPPARPAGTTMTTTVTHVERLTDDELRTFKLLLEKVGITPPLLPPAAIDAEGQVEP